MTDFTWVPSTLLPVHGDRDQHGCQLSCHSARDHVTLSIFFRVCLAAAFPNSAASSFAFVSLCVPNKLIAANQTRASISPKCCLCQDPTGHLGVFNRQRHLLSGLEKSGFWGQQSQTQGRVLWGGRYSEAFCLSSAGWATIPELYQDILLCSIPGLLTIAGGFLCSSL